MDLRSLCPADKCYTPVDKNKAFCDACWKQIDMELRDWISRLWGVDGMEDELVRAVKHACRALKKGKP